MFARDRYTEPVGGLQAPGLMARNCNFLKNSGLSGIFYRESPIILGRNCTGREDFPRRQRERRLAKPRIRVSRAYCIALFHISAVLRRTGLHGRNPQPMERVQLSS